MGDSANRQTWAALGKKEKANKCASQKKETRRIVFGILFCAFFSFTTCDFVKLKPDANEDKKGSEPHANGWRRRTGVETTGFRNDSDNLSIEQRHCHGDDVMQTPVVKVKKKTQLWS
jgi:hypothetical protein